MDSTAKPRRNLDTSKLVFSQKNISSKQALSEVAPFYWSDNVRAGAEKVLVTAKSTQSR